MDGLNTTLNAPGYCADHVLSECLLNDSDESEGGNWA